MAGFADYSDLHPPLTLSYAGKAYTLPEVGVQHVDAMVRTATKPDADDALSDAEVEEILLGEAGKQMRADNVPAGFQDRVARTAWGDFRYGRAMAEAIWATEGDPVRVAAFLNDRVAALAPDTVPADIPAEQDPAEGTGMPE